MWYSNPTYCNIFTWKAFMNNPQNPTASKSSMNFSDLTFAYLKNVKTSSGTVVAVFNTNGEKLAEFPSRDAAYFAAKQHDLEPVLLH